MVRNINQAKSTFCFLDDILIVSRVVKPNIKFYQKQYRKIDDENLAFKYSKCEFFENRVDWLAHRLSESGVSPKFNKTEAIQNLNPLTESLKQLRSFLGSMIHLSKFIPYVASTTENLRSGLKEENQNKKLKT